MNNFNTEGARIKYNAAGGLIGTTIDKDDYVDLLIKKSFLLPIIIGAFQIMIALMINIIFIIHINLQF